MTLDRTSYQGETLGVELPVTVDLLVAETEPGLRRRHGPGRAQERDAGDRPRGHGAAVRERGRHPPDRHPDRRVPDPPLDGPRRRSGSRGADAPDPSRPTACCRPGTPVPDDADAGAVPRRPRRARAARFGLRVRTVSEVSARHPGPRPRRTTACATCGSRARSAGSRCPPPATPTSRSRTPAPSSSASGSATSASARRSSRRPASQVVAHGRMDLFEPQGALQLYVESLQPAGFGNLALRFEQTQGAPGRRGPVRRGAQAPAAGPPADDRASSPRPRAPSGATCATCSRGAGRWRACCWSPCQVQGDGAPASIVAALRRARARRSRTSAAAGREADDAPARDDPRPRRRLARRTSGRSTTSGSCARSSRTRCRWCAGSATRRT